MIVTAFVYVGLRRQGIGLSEIPQAIADGLAQLWKRLSGE